MDVEQTHSEDLDSSLISIEHCLSGFARRSLDLVPGRGVDRVDGVHCHHATKRRKDRTAHQGFRFGDIICEGQFILDAILNRRSKVDEIAITGQQRGTLRRYFFLEPESAGTFWRLA